MFKNNNDLRDFTIISILLILLSVIVTTFVTNTIEKNVRDVDVAITDNLTRINELEAELNEKVVEIEVLNNKLNDLDSLTKEVYERQTETKILEMQIEMNEVEKLHDTDLKEYYLEYMDIVERYSLWLDPPTTIYEALSEEEIMYLWRMVESETCGCPFESRVHVADVVFNRIEAEEWPNTVKEVITQPNQFCYTKTSISEETKMAVEYAFMFPDETQGALSFHSNAKSNTFGKYVYYFSDKSHHFYGHQPRGGE